MIKILSYILPLVFGALITYFVTRKEDDGSLEVLKEEKATLLHQADSIHRLQVDLVRRDTLATRVHIQDSLALVRANEETNQWRINYGKISHTPVVHYTSIQLDSVISALVNH